MIVKESLAIVFGDNEAGRMMDPRSRIEEVENAEVYGSKDNVKRQDTRSKPLYILFILQMNFVTMTNNYESLESQPNKR